MKNRLVIFTGKGGVGKTTLAMAYAKSLKQKKLNVLYNSFYQPPDVDILGELALPYLDITIQDSAEIYIANKLNSKTIAAWIMHTHFFKSLFQMIPSLGHMILMGHILKELENDPSLIIVLDSPASGHALTMFEASNNFQKIFKTGLIVKDIEKMKATFERLDFLKTFIIALPTELALAEASELDQELSIIYKNNEVIINNSFKLYCEKHEVPFDTLPDFLNQRIKNEDSIDLKLKKISHFAINNFTQVVREISSDIGETL